MTRVRNHRRLAAALAFALLALIAELGGRSLTHRIDVGRHVRAPHYSDAGYYPILLGAVKLAVALLLARLLWRFLRARSSARAAGRILGAVGAPAERMPRVRIQLSPRLWLLSFSVTAGIFLVQTDAERLSTGRWPLLAPWLHSSALPVFAVLSVLLALLWRAVANWLSDYESYAASLIGRACRLAAWEPPPARRTARLADHPRRLFGVVFESRPPPLPV